MAHRRESFVADSRRPVEDAFDARLRKTRGAFAGGRVDAYLSTKGALRKYGPVLSNPALRIAEGPLDAELGGITNRMLLEAVGGNPDDLFKDYDAITTAMAIRLVQMGSPAVSVSVGGFDLHSEEDTKAPLLYSRFARYLAGLHFALSRMQDQSGGSLLDSTLVVTTSEFGRNETDNGFNEAGGSDHGNDTPSWRNQAHVCFGGGVKPKALYTTNDNNEPEGGKALSTHALLATLALSLGAPQAEVDAAWPPGSELYPEALPVSELWE